MEKLQNNIKKIFLILTPVLFVLFFASQTKAEEISLRCSNRYLTLINPVRDRSLWTDRSLDPLRQQYTSVKKYSFSATWLLQYDTFSDSELIKEILLFDTDQEKGIFLEISRKLASDAGVAYPIYVRWSDPSAIFLSAYSQSERRRIIDEAFDGYKKIFGLYPKSVGAWWVDSYSLDYMVDKYKVSSVLIVADQKVTDSYGVWGQWWGFAYKPSKANILMPASDASNVQNVTILQWAQRDPLLAYGGAGVFSRYSLQANDYVVVEKNINYFKDLVSQYLNCKNTLGQITVGLETGMESLIEPVEYQRQLLYLSTILDLNVVTMENFADKYSQIYKINPDKVFFGDTGSSWEMTPNFRKNEKLGDVINYNQNLAFKDYFLKDSSNFLDRVMPINGNTRSLTQWYLIVLFILLLISFKLSLFKVWFTGILISFVSYGLLLRSTYKFGWEVFYGPQVGELALIQVLSVVAVFAVTLFISRISKNKFNLWLLPLAFGLDRMFSLLRYTSIEGIKYLGIIFGINGLVGFKIFGRSLAITHQNFEPIQFHALTKIDFSEVWQNQFLYFIAYPFLNLALAFTLWKIIAVLPRKIRFVIYAILVILFIWKLQTIFTADPLSVLPIK